MITAPTIDNPVGIDRKIQQLQLKLQSELSSIWGVTSYTSFGRAVLNKKGTGFIPEVFIGTGKGSGKEYFDILQSDYKNIAGHSFFVQSENPTHIEGNLYQASVDIVFQLNLPVIYGSLSNRADEEVHADVVSVIYKKSTFQISGMTLNEPAYSGFAVNAQKVYNMQPFHIFRINTNVTYNLSTPCSN